MRSDAGKRRAWLGRLIVVELIVCYLAVLALISHARGPEKYRIAEESPLLAAGDFTSLVGGAAEEGRLRLVNDTQGQAVGYFAELPLEGLESIRVAFQVDCPVEYAGGTLVVDLYNLEAGYDYAEQEYQLILEPGINMVAQTIEPGGSAPERAQLRLFSVDAAGYSIEGLTVSPLETLPKISTAMAAAAIFCFVLLGGTAAAWLVDRKSSQRAVI